MHHMKLKEAVKGMFINNGYGGVYGGGGGTEKREKKDRFLATLRFQHFGMFGSLVSVEDTLPHYYTSKSRCSSTPTFLKRKPGSVRTISYIA